METLRKKLGVPENSNNCYWKNRYKRFRRHSIWRVALPKLQCPGRSMFLNLERVSRAERLTGETRATVPYSQNSLNRKASCRVADGIHRRAQPARSFRQSFRQSPLPDLVLLQCRRRQRRVAGLKRIAFDGRSVLGFASSESIASRRGDPPRTVRYGVPSRRIGSRRRSAWKRRRRNADHADRSGCGDRFRFSIGVSADGLPQETSPRNYGYDQSNGENRRFFRLKFGPRRRAWTST